MAFMFSASAISSGEMDAVLELVILGNPPRAADEDVERGDHPPVKESQEHEQAER
jgi:hypothetical protein